MHHLLGRRFLLRAAAVAQTTCAQRTATTMATERNRVDAARELMDSFAQQTGLTQQQQQPPVRYLWTDAYAVSNFLALADDSHYADLADALVEQVHGVLGRHRDDDDRAGTTLSGLDEEAAKEQPTLGSRTTNASNGRKTASISTT